MKYSYESIREIISRSLSENGSLIVSIDGCCASGKSTLAQQLCADLDGDLIHADDFFLPPALRTQARLQEPGGNIHYERFLSQIITPLLSARKTQHGQSDTEAAKYAACDNAQRRSSVSPHEGPVSLPLLQWEHFSCSSLTYSPDLHHTKGKPLLIIEGAYCMRPEFRPAYDLSFFLHTSRETQLERIRNRNGDEGANAFATKWIPLENRYFSFYDIPHCCHYRIET